MTHRWQPIRQRLAGKRLVVLAEEPFLTSPVADQPSSPMLETEEAVISLVRAIVAEGGEVTVIADPSLAFLAAVIAGEYALPYLEENVNRPRPPVSVAVLGGTDDWDPFRHLEVLGAVNVMPAESRRAVLGQASRGASALVCVGTGSADDLLTFRDASGPGSEIFVIAATGVDLERLGRWTEQVLIADYLVDREAPLPRAEAEAEVREAEPEMPLPPVALCAQWIVERLIGRSPDLLYR